MKLSELRDAAEAALAADRQAADELAAAQAKQEQAAQAVEDTRGRFAKALLAAGGRSIDEASAPPRLYTADAQGEGYTVEEIPTLDTDVSDPESPGPVS